MPSINLPANGNCPKCGAQIKVTRIEPHPSKPEAFHYYDCPKCGQVMVRVHDLKPKPTK